MSIQLQLRRGTTAENNAFTGAQGEITVDTDNLQLRVHDGQTPGGAGVIDPVVAFQVPTTENNYTWYRKYRSGWVEQGGIITGLTNGAESWTSVTINLPATMSNNKYTTTTSDIGIGANAIVGSRIEALSTTSFVFKYYNASDSSVVGWMACGMAAN